MSHRMETSEDFGRSASFHAPGLSSTSGEGEGGVEKGAYNFTARRKNRRKTITLNDIQRLTTGTQSLSESAFGTPSPAPYNTTLPTSGLRLQTSFNPLDYNDVPPAFTPNSSPRRTSGRYTVNSSPVKQSADVRVPGVSIASRDTIAADVLKELERGRGRGIPRTLTLPVHLTESLMKMKITRERDGSADVMGIPPEIEVRSNMEKVDKDGMDVDGMEVDAAEPRKSKPTLFVQTQSTEATIPPDQVTPPRSPRKGKRRRARSAPPRQRANPHADACDGDDEDGGTTEGEENDVGPLSPAPAPRRRGRQDANSAAMGIGEEPMEMTMAGMMPVASGVLRRSARRVKPAGTGIGPVFGGANQFLKDIVEAEAGSGMEFVDVTGKGIASRKRARTREAETGSGMEVAEVARQGNSPRKRARTREGGDRDKERGRDEGERATKRTRKR